MGQVGDQPEDMALAQLRVYRNRCLKRGGQPPLPIESKSFKTTFSSSDIFFSLKSWLARGEIGEEEGKERQIMAEPQ